MRSLLGSAALLAAAAIARTVQATPLNSTFDRRNLAFNFDSDKVRGVNLGGWLVLEPWITPSLFTYGPTVVDEYTLTQHLGQAAALKILQNHWNTWITEADFVAIKAAGLNVVRIPIGYWALDPVKGDPYCSGQVSMLDEAIKWARQVGLKVMIDLHGAPGSQNGFDNSGRLGPITWLGGNTVSMTLTAIDMLTKRYQHDTDVVVALELLNEPAGFALPLDQIKNFYQRGYNTVRSTTGDIAVVMHDAFKDPTSWNGFATPASSGDQRVVLDTHQYQVFTNDQVAMSPTKHVSAACALGMELARTDKWTIVGEFTGAQTDCAKWLNGYGIGARYDGTYRKNGETSSHVGDCVGKYTGTAAGLSGADKSNIRHFIEAQLDAYDRHTGWIFWTWKTESAPEWNMKDLLAHGLFPQPLTARQYPGQCAVSSANH